MKDKKEQVKLFVQFLEDRGMYKRFVKYFKLMGHSIDLETYYEMMDPFVWISSAFRWGVKSEIEGEGGITLESYDVWDSMHQEWILYATEHLMS